MKLIAKPNFIDRTIYTENLAAVHMGKTSLLFDKPIFIGMAVLELSKTLMYSFHYDVMVQKYGPNLKLLYTDTDSTIYHIKTKDLYTDMISLHEHLDTSDYPASHPGFFLRNKKVLGKFKDEVNGRIIRKFIGLRPKMYALDVEGEITKKAKGVQRSALRSRITIFRRNTIFKFINQHSNAIYTIQTPFYTFRRNKQSVIVCVR
jgi:hypothetical protein